MLIIWHNNNWISLTLKIDLKMILYLFNCSIQSSIYPSMLIILIIWCIHVPQFRIISSMSNFVYCHIEGLVSWQTSLICSNYTSRVGFYEIYFLPPICIHMGLLLHMKHVDVDILWTNYSLYEGMWPLWWMECDYGPIM